MQGRRFNNDSRDFGRAPPVNVGDELDVKIEAVGEKGDGVAKKDGFVLFVPNVKEGENVRIKITRVLRKVGFADVIGKSEGPVQTDEESEPVEEAEQDFNEEKDSDNFGEEESAEESPEETVEETAEESTEDKSSNDFGEEKKDDDSDAFGQVSDDEPSEDFSEDEEDKK